MRHPRRDATDMRRPMNDIATYTHPPRAQHKNEKRRDDKMLRREAYNETRKREAQRDAATRSYHETHNETPNETEETRRQYISKANYWPRKKLSAFSTMT